MEQKPSTNDMLLTLVRRVCANPPVGVKPWRGEYLTEIAAYAQAQASDPGAFFLEFMEGIRNMLDEQESYIIRHFASQTLLAEARVHADDPGVRDHLKHVIQVYLCGWLLLNSCSRFWNAPEDWQPYDWRVNCEERFERLNRAWLIAALLHDCAYSIEKAQEAWRHEHGVRALFGSLYMPGKCGGVDLSEVERQVGSLWQIRGKWIGQDTLSLKGEPPAEALEGLRKQYRRPDHAILGGLALIRAAEDIKNLDPRLAEILIPASVAVACHNFRWLVDTEKEVSDQPNLWLRLDLYQEPLAVILHLCDELQEWDRERADESLAYLQARRLCRFAETDLTDLTVDDTIGISVEVRLLRRLYPGDRHARDRIRWQQEIEIAKVGRQLRLLLEPRSHKSEFRLRLRLEQTIEERPCRNNVTVGWPVQEQGLLERLGS